MPSKTDFMKTYVICLKFREWYSFFISDVLKLRYTTAEGPISIKICFVKFLSAFHCNSDLLTYTEEILNGCLCSVMYCKVFHKCFKSKIQ